MEHSKFDPEKLELIISKYKNEKWGLIPLLQDIQAEFGYIPPEAIKSVASALGLYPGKVQGVIQFYSGFSMVPRGKHIIKICCGTACHVKGGRRVLSTAKKDLGINEGETSPDYQCSLETVACLGACFLAPTMMVNKNYYGKLSTQKVGSILSHYTKEEEAHKKR